MLRNFDLQESAVAAHVWTVVTVAGDRDLCPGL